MSALHAIVGLGNPGRRYEHTRHNVGFRVVEAFAAGERVALDESEAGARVGRLVDGDTTIFLAQPQLYMNRSGPPVARLLAQWGVAPPDLLVVHDDIDLEPGRLKLKRGGGAGGHRGILSIEEATGTREFCRLRVGVGRPEPGGGDAADWVLDPLEGLAWEALEATVERAREALRDWIRLDFEAAVQRVNTPRRMPVEPSGPGC